MARRALPGWARGPRLLGALAGVVLAGVGGGAYLVAADGGATAGTGESAAPQAVVPTPVSALGLERRVGVRIVHVALTGADGLVDLRYQVVDPDKAAAVHESAPELVDEGSDAVVDDLLMGHQHTGALHAGQTYYLIFLNPGNLVARGDRVTVALGGVRVPHVPVR